MSKTNIFLISWDCTGLEACVDITEKVDRGNAFEKDSLFERIKNPEEEPHNQYVAEINKMFHVMSLRARFNPQRNYEIYSIHTTEGITKDDLVTMFNEDPQSAADLIRDRGTKLLSHRETSQRVIS